MLGMLKEFWNHCLEEQRWWDKKRASEPVDPYAVTILFGPLLGLSIGLGLTMLIKSLA